ncbi:I78 family peptidase inhibitor [uncultured Maricaulis sp.]|uniref:I78 family peptidase inhibitor n=1 Tax=uncultured Maricaulis sp. TaxID=174710 RepID=UPI0030DB818B|tara:strand:+ start:17598 stop:17987 length:390 start_codon:yes stop_codon:yes gene_type:complete
MQRVSILLAGLILAGCAFDLSPGRQRAVPMPEPAATQPVATAQPASDMPAMGEVQDIGTAQVQRPITGSCGMEALQHYVGQPRIAVDSRTLPDNYRVVGRYSRVTMDFIPERLTIRIADDDTVESLTCG